MKVVILAGGFGTRLSEYTGTIPKPMVPIGGKPILAHILNIYRKYGHKDFYIALGYKGQIIRKYFSNKKNLKRDIRVNLIDTGSNTLTGGRLLRLRKYLRNETFLLTYGDGVSNVNLNKLVNFHKKNKKMVTVTAVRPPARFGALEIKNNKVVKFTEKNQSGDNWINGGFFVMEPKFFKFLKNDKTILERKPLEKVSKLGELIAFKHAGFWQCMDHKSDKDILDSMIKKKRAVWL
tara:strand:- start:995 stop:1699 length:705 start_codon:yes stop_codon:yes gene_type:complete